MKITDWSHYLAPTALRTPSSRSCLHKWFWGTLQQIRPKLADREGRCTCHTNRTRSNTLPITTTKLPHFLHICKPNIYPVFFFLTYLTSSPTQHLSVELLNTRWGNPTCSGTLAIEQSIPVLLPASSRTANKTAGCSTVRLTASLSNNQTRVWDWHCLGWNQGKGRAQWVQCWHFLSCPSHSVASKPTCVARGNAPVPLAEQNAATADSSIST